MTTERPPNSMPKLPLTRLMSGETTVEVFGDIFAGDIVEVTRVLVDIYEKRGLSGPLIFLVFEISQVNQRGERVARELQISILR